jgi:acyl-CoA thioesterase-1
MANALVYHVASGQAFFSGIALIHLALFCGFRAGGRWRTLGGTLPACAGLILVAVSATPLPAWFYGIAGVLTLAWIAMPRATRWFPHRSRVWVGSALLAVCWLGIALELPYHIVHAPPRLGDPPIYVVGDSLSSGVGGESATWPSLLAQRHHVVVHDLSVAGASVATAPSQAERVTDSSSLVLLEIGGNDVLGKTTPETFEQGLARLLSKLRDTGCTVILLELPLSPFANRFGAIQRRLARRYGALLIPKRLLLGVLMTEGATLDSIHLSRHGHELMAEAIWDAIRGSFDPRSVTTNSRGAESERPRRIPMH